MRGDGQRSVWWVRLDTKRQKEGLSKKGKKTKEYLTYYIIKETIYAAKSL